MQGSLDQPPIIIRSSPKMSALMLIIAIIFVTLCVFLLRGTPEDQMIAYSGIGFFGLGIPLFAWRLIRPDSLTLSADGITWRNALRTARWPWGDVHAFRAYMTNSKNLVKHTGFDFTDGYRARTERDFRTIKAITSVEGSLGSGWELNAAKLAELLNEARARWTDAA